MHISLKEDFNSEGVLNLVILFTFAHRKEGSFLDILTELGHLCIIRIHCL